jgi:hypothetical protein
VKTKQKLKFEKVLRCLVIVAFLSMNTDNWNLKQFNQNISEYLKEKSMVKVEDFKEAFL